MSLAIDFLIVVFLLLGVYAGQKKGLIKSLVSLVGLVAVIIISYSLRYYLAEFLIDNMPFFNFVGFEGLTALNILVYNVLAFIVIFILLYCVLNIIISVTGFIDTLLKFTVIWIIPSKIGGAIIGFVEAWVFLFLVVFALGSFNISANWILDSKISDFMINHTPVVGNYLYGVATGAKEIYTSIKELQEDESNSTQDINLHILQLEISYGLITKDKAQELIDTGKLDLNNVMFGKGFEQWLNI